MPPVLDNFPDLALSIDELARREIEDNKAKNRVALVVGACKREGNHPGIGMATAYKLGLGMGFHVAGTYNSSASGAEELAEHFSRYSDGRDFLGIQANMDDYRESVPAMMEQIKERFGRLDVVVYSVSRTVRAKQLLALQDGEVELTDDDWEDIITGNVHGFRKTAISAVELMRENDYTPGPNGYRGKIINLGSSSGVYFWSPNRAPYDASKVAEDTIVKDVALETGRDGILVMNLITSVVDSATIEPVRAKYHAWAGEKDDTGRFRHAALGRIASPEEITNVVSHLVSQGTTFSTGGTYEATGGILTRL